jgi:hypothetical protein
MYASFQQAGSASLNGVGIELGYRAMDDLWLSAGYTVGQYADNELFASNTKRSGWHTRLRYSFDEQTFAGNDPRYNRTLDAAGKSEKQSPRQWRE